MKQTRSSDALEKKLAFLGPCSGSNSSHVGKDACYYEVSRFSKCGRLLCIMNIIVGSMTICL